MANVWERFNDIADTKEVAEERAKYAPLESGTYKMKLEEIKADEDQNGLPVIKIRFRTTTNKVVFYNLRLQNLNYPEMTAGNIAKAVEFVSSIVGEEIGFTTLSAFADLIDRIPVGGMYNVKVSFATKDVDKKYPVLTVIDGELPA